MAIIRRAPRDTAFIGLNRVMPYVKQSAGLVTQSGSPAHRVINNQRPGYAEQTFTSLPGGTRFRKPTPYAAHEWSVGEYSPATLKGPVAGRLRDFYDYGQDGSFFLNGPPNLVGSGVIPEAQENEAVTKALLKLANQKANVGEALATAGQTARLFSSNVGGLAAALMSGYRNRSFRPWLWKSYRQLVREGIPEFAARKYLEYIYGLAPLMKDVHGLHEMLKGESDKSLLLYGHGKSTRTYYRGEDQIYSSSTSRRQRLNWRADIRVKCALWARIDPEWGALRALNQLGLLNPGSLAWELVPWSFVVDWVLPIGPVLQAMSAPAGLIFTGGSISKRHDENHDVKYEIAIGSNDLSQAISTPAMVPVRYEGYVRRTYNTWPRPGLYLDTDPFRGDRSFKAVALALVTLGNTKDKVRYGRF